MPYAPHIRMTAIGRLGTATKEKFAYSLNLGRSDNGVIPYEPNSTVWNDLANDVRAWHSGNSYTSVRAVLEVVKFAYIGPNGKYTADPIIVDVVDTPGAVMGVNVAPQVALAISLNTNRRGATGRGRFYQPMPGIDIGNDLLVPDGIRDAAQAAAAQFLANVGNQPGLDVMDIHAVVASNKGYNSRVTGVRVGRVLDTVRSRRRQLPESYDPITPVSTT